MNKKNLALIIIIIAATLFVATFNVTVFSKNIYGRITESIYTQLREISSQSAVTINSHIMEQLTTLSTMAEYISASDDYKGEATYLLLNAAYNNKGFLRISINFPGGSRITHDKLNDGNVSDREYFIKSMRGEIAIEGPSPSIAEPEKTVIVMAVPIYKDNEIVASLSATYDIGELHKLFNLSFLDKNGYMFIAKSDGTIITDVPQNDQLGKGDNFLDYVDNYSKDEESYSEIKKQLKSGDKGNNFTLYTEEEALYVNFMQVGINDWYIFSLAPENVMEKRASGIWQALVNLGVVIAACVIVLVGFIIYIQVTARNKALLNEHCFHMLAEQTGRVIFEWDFDKNRITMLNNFTEIFGRKAVTVNSSDDAILAGVIHEDDVEVFRKVFSDLLLGNNIDTAKFRIKNARGDFLWCTLSGIVIKGRGGKPYKAIGSLENINEQEKEAEKLRKRNAIDGLTGLYNKATIESIVAKILEGACDRNMHAIISADIDNFKNINDSFGHLFGDDVLKDASIKMKEMFRSTDILGRFGGDEFVLFIRDIPNVDFIKEKVNELVRKFEIVYRVGEVGHKISLSVGIALYPQNGTTYEELFKVADDALYMAKRSGKNKCLLYDEIKEQEKF